MTDLLIAVFARPWVEITCVVVIVAGWIVVVWIRTGEALTKLQSRLEDRETSLRIALTDLGRCERELAALRTRAREAGLPVTAPAENVPARSRRWGR